MTEGGKRAVGVHVWLEFSVSGHVCWLLAVHFVLFFSCLTNY